MNEPMYAKAKSRLTLGRFFILVLIITLITWAVIKRNIITAYVFSLVTHTSEVHPKEVKKQSSLPPSDISVEKHADDALKQVNDLTAKINGFEKQLSEMSKQIKFLENRPPVSTPPTEVEKPAVTAPVPNPDIVAVLKKPDEAAVAFKAASEVKQVFVPPPQTPTLPPPLRVPPQVPPPTQQVQHNVPPPLQARIPEPVRRVLADGTIVDMEIGDRR